MLNKCLTINAISPDGEVYEGVASCIFLPGRQFPFEVLPGHAPIISTLAAGEIRIVPSDGEETVIKVRSGVARVKDDKVTICVEM